VGIHTRLRDISLSGLLLLGIAAALSPAGAAREFEKVGTVGGQFLKIGIGARAAAMGETFVALADDATTVYWNPAGLARLDGSLVSVSHVEWPADISLEHAAYVFHIAFFPGTFALHARALTMDEMPVRTVFRPEGDGTMFDAGDLSLGVSYGKSFTDKFSAGVGMNFVQSTLASFQATGLAFDFGTLYDTGFRSLRIGMAIQNIGTDLVFVGDAVKLPAVFRVGISMTLAEAADYSLVASGEFQHPSDNHERANTGFELAWRRPLFLRGGLFYRYDTERLAAGLGVILPMGVGWEGRVDYAYTEMAGLPSVHRISLELRF
jgi:hypothetical protein